MLKYHKMDTCVEPVKQTKYNFNMRSNATEIIYNENIIITRKL